MKIEKTLGDWFNAFTKKDYEGICKPISNGFIMHLEGRAQIIRFSE